MTVASQEVELRQDSSRRNAEAAFEAAFLEHWPRVYGVLFRLVGDRAEAEDLALEAFWRLFQLTRAGGPPDGRALNLGGWLYRVATNLGLNAIRAWKRRARYELDAGRSADAGNAGPGPEELLVEAEARQRVRQVLAEMNPRHSQVLILRYSGLAYREIAAAVGVSPKSVGTLLARAEQEFERQYRRATSDGRIAGSGG